MLSGFKKILHPTRSDFPPDNTNLLSDLKKIMHPTKSNFPPDNTSLIVTSDTFYTVDMTGEFSPESGD